YRTAAEEIAYASDLYRREGWLDDPVSYHRDPPPPEWYVIDRRRAFDVRFEHVQFRTGFEPRPTEPGHDRWMAHQANATMHAWVLRHRSEPRPWIVCIHGFGMGAPFLDLRAFRAVQLYRQGLNVIAPVLPLHGPRADSGVRGEGFMTINLVDSVHGLTQSAWDLRRVIRWLRIDHGAERIGLFGISLGGYVAALVASLEPDLQCAIAGIPFVDLPSLYRRHSPARVGRHARQCGALGETADAVHRVVSPLAMDPLVPSDRRFIFAGLGDRMSTYGQARRLWVHWGQPAFACYGGGHVGFYWSGEVNRFVADAVRASGLLPSQVPATSH
ncbi:MAG: alpha/beta hydrolase family protein, partial [Acidimicrobiia bacterium]